jgi:hypothetical protein
MGALLNNARPFRVQAPPGMEGFVPQTTGGVNDAIPAGGFGPNVTRFFSPDAAAAAEGHFAQAVSPFAGPPDLAAAGYGEAGVAPTATANSARDAALERYKSFYDSDFARSRAQREAMLRALKINVPGITSPASPAAGSGSRVRLNPQPAVR